MKFAVLRIPLMLTILIVSSFQSHAADYYVVVGTFIKEINARQYTTQIRKHFKDASYRFNEGTGVFYVHVLKTSQRDQALACSIRLRDEKAFSDAWVLTDAQTLSEGTRTRSLHRPARYTGDMRGKAFGHKLTPAKEVCFTTNVDKIKRSNLSAGTVFLRFIVEDGEGRPAPAEIMLVDTRNQERLATFAANRQVAFHQTSEERTISFVCTLPGYAQETRTFNLDELFRSFEPDKAGVWETCIKLRKMRLGDVSVLNNTIFYEDAAVFLPSSEKELKSLVQMMRANPAYEIIVHSDCHPLAKSTIKVPAGTAYFDLQGAREAGGSDKLLTRKRAEAVRDYLADHGVSRKRIGVAGWGSARPLGPSSADDHAIHDRLEVEVVSD